MKGIILFALLFVCSCSDLRNDPYRAEINRYAGIAHSHSDTAHYFFNKAMTHSKSDNMDSYFYYVDKFFEQTTLYATYGDSFVASVRKSQE